MQLRFWNKSKRKAASTCGHITLRRMGLVKDLPTVIDESKGRSMRTHTSLYPHTLAEIETSKKHLATESWLTRARNALPKKRITKE